MEKFHREVFSDEAGDGAVEFDSWASSAGEIELSKAKGGESGLKRLVMVRKSEQRTYLTTKTGEEPQLETLTRETIETFSGGRRVSTQERKHVQPKPKDDEIFEVALAMQKSVIGIPEVPLAVPEEIVPEPEVKKVVTVTETPKKKKSDDQEDLDQFNKFDIECLRRHNELRAKHGCPKMKLDRELCNFATGWAQRCANMNALQHSTTHSENIAMSGAASVTGATPVDMWYSEIKYHNYCSNNFVYQTGHFTQVVWKDSVRLGVGVAQSQNGAWYMVSAYEPRGNYAGRFVENVPRPIA